MTLKKSYHLRKGRQRRVQRVNMIKVRCICVSRCHKETRHFVRLKTFLKPTCFVLSQPTSAPSSHISRVYWVLNKETWELHFALTCHQGGVPTACKQTQVRLPRQARVLFGASCFNVDTNPKPQIKSPFSHLCEEKRTKSQLGAEHIHPVQENLLMATPFCVTTL